MDNGAGDSDDFAESPKWKKPKSVPQPQQPPPTPHKPFLAVPVSRFRNRKAKRSLLFMSPKALKQSMDEAQSKLFSTKVAMYQCGLTPSLVLKFPALEKYVCWTSRLTRGCSVSVSTSASGVGCRYFKVSAGKSVKFQAHKLVLCCHIGVLYTKLEGQGHEASHLCHNRDCWRPLHMHAENHKQNVARNSGVACAGVVVNLHDGSMLNLCLHTPSCMFVRVVEKAKWEKL